MKTIRRKAKDLENIPSPEDMLKTINKMELLRDRALFSTLYLTGKRISEILNTERRDYHFQRVHDEDILFVRVTVLKRKDYPVQSIPVPPESPFGEILAEWLRDFDYRNLKGRVFNITRQRAWQICKETDKNLWNHFFRHVRMTHMGRVMNIWELTDFGKWKSANTAVNYIHGSAENTLDKMRKTQ